MTIDEKLWELGREKESGLSLRTWESLAKELNEFSNRNNTESYWRKKFKSMQMKEEARLEEEAVEKQEKEEEILNNVADNLEVDRPNKYDKKIAQQQIKDERSAVNALIRSMARQDRLLDVFVENIKKVEPIKTKVCNVQRTNKSMIAMLSDIHYGIQFSNRAGEYSPEIAEERLMRYETEIELNGEDCEDCYLLLMGDLISGNIHSTTRAQNRDDLIEQVIKVSELIAEFINRLSSSFNHVYVLSVPGNHSRIDKDVEEVMRNEKLDTITFWYCKAKLQLLDNVSFVENTLDSTIGFINIRGKNYAVVHGDMENNNRLKEAVGKIERLAREHIDYMLAGHMHVPEIRLEETGYITNGSVCGSGDDYTLKKRLFAPAQQVCFTCDELGIVSIYPIILR